MESIEYCTDNNESLERPKGVGLNIDWVEQLCLTQHVNDMTLIENVTIDEEVVKEQSARILRIIHGEEQYKDTDISVNILDFTGLEYERVWKMPSIKRRKLAYKIIDLLKDYFVGFLIYVDDENTLTSEGVDIYITIDWSDVSYNRYVSKDYYYD